MGVVIYFAHNGAHHASEVEAAVHDASDNTVWIVAGSMVMAAALYVVIRLLAKRLPEEQEANRETLED